MIAPPTRTLTGTNKISRCRQPVEAEIRHDVPPARLDSARRQPVLVRPCKFSHFYSFL